MNKQSNQSDSKEEVIVEGKTWHDVMKQYKPDITLEEAEYVLWEQTCYPFDNKTTLQQIEDYFSTQSQSTVNK